MEAKIVASADAMAHITEIPSLFEFTYGVRRIGIEEGREWVLKKITKSYKKLMPEAKKMVKKEFEAAKIILTSDQ